MYKTKTAETAKDVNEFIEQVENPVKTKDSHDQVFLLRSLTGFDLYMWGSYDYRIGKLSP